MAGGPPILSIGAEGYIGAALQSVFGTPTSPIPANAINWYEFTARDLEYDAAWKAIETGAGTRATERKAGRGMSLTKNGWTMIMQPTAGAALLAWALGLDTYATATHTITPTLPKLLTLQKIMAGQALQYQDCVIDSLAFQQSGAEWSVKLGVLGGLGDVPIVSDTPTMPTDALVFQWGDTTLTTAFGSLSQAEMGALQWTIANNVRQYPGAGSFAPTKTRGGKLGVSGSCTYLYDSTAAATAQANYINGTEATLTVVLTKDSTHKQTYTFPNCHMTANVPKDNLDDLVEMSVQFFTREPEGISIVIKNDDVAGY